MASGTNRSGTANTTSQTLAAARPRRNTLIVQNLGAANIAINEFGGAAALGSANTWTVTPGSFLTIYTNNAVTVIAAAGTCVYTAVER